MKTLATLAGLLALGLAADVIEKRSAYPFAGVYSPVYTVSFPHYLNPVPPPTAVAEIRSMGDVEGSDGVEGYIMFTQTVNGIVLISGNITGLTEGQHGFHIHDLGDTREGCKSMGPHFNPGLTHHGGPADPYRHVGDLGNIVAGSDGAAHIQESDHLITLTGPNSIVGRGIVVHANKDDFGRGGDKESLKTGNAGGRVACGVIGWAKPMPPIPHPQQKPESNES
uniref:Superoxide dismutase [Cu-Zn] n=1 Tax=Lygus hesperus TaxID=30085 RepID=A0A146M700_LYGHE